MTQLPGRPSTLTNLAATLLKQGRPADALAPLDEVLAQSPQDTEALGHRGVALSQLNRPLDASEAFEQLVQLAPDRPEAPPRRTGNCSTGSSPPSGLTAAWLRPPLAPAEPARHRSGPGPRRAADS
jgi:tetratricopeptide (TPR) repeat protein